MSVTGMSVTGEYVPTTTVQAVGPITSGETFSPFGEVLSDTAPPTSEGASPPVVLESPFGSGFTRELDRSEAELLAEAARQTFAELDDEDFTDALEALVDEAAARQVTDTGAWSAAPSPAQAHALLSEWVEPLATESERALDTLVQHLGGIDPQTIRAEELEQLLDAVGEHTPTGNEVFDSFLGSLLRKAKRAVGGAVSLVKRGIAAVGKILPIGVLLNRLKALVRPLLNRVLQAAIGRLPASVQPVARTLAGKLGLGEAQDHEDRGDGVARLGEEFDIQVAGLLLAPEVETDLRELEAPDVGIGEYDPAGELDDARARLAQRLGELPAGASPAAEIERFIPAVLAVKPLIKLGISMIGRDKVVGFIADRIAALVQPLIGAEASRQLARPLVDVGLRMLGFESSPAEPAALAGEALASTVEGTVMRLTELPAEAFGDELQLEAAIQSAFAEAAAGSVPARLLRPDLPERETAGEGGVWILMPRSARPRFRCRKYTKVFVIPITRQIARAIPWSDGGTLESHLLDRGAERWPVNAEVELFEALPGSQLGHLAAVGDETGTGGGEAASELQPLTPEVAGLLLREPGLGRSRWPESGRGGGAGAGFPGLPVREGDHRRDHCRPWPGRRYYRVRPLVGGVGAIGTATGRPRRKVAVRLSLIGSAPSLRVAIRLSERQGQHLLNRLDPAARRGGRDLPGAMAELTTQLRAALPSAVAGRLIRHGVVTDAAAGPTADRVSAAVLSALSGFLSSNAHLLVAAVRDPAQGATLTVTFSGIAGEDLASGLPAGRVGVTPGWGRRG